MKSPFSELESAVDVSFDHLSAQIRKKFPKLPDAAVNFAATQMLILIAVDLNRDIDRDRFMAVLNQACALCSDD